MPTIKEYTKMVTSMWGSGYTSKFDVLQEDARMAIAVLLSLKGPLTAKQMANELELSPSTVLDHLEKMLVAGIIKEVDVAEKKYKQERYYDIDILHYLEEEEKEIDRRISKYVDILNETAKAVYSKCLRELSEYFGELQMARHGMTLERDEVRMFIWSKISGMVQSYFSKQGFFKEADQTEKKAFIYLGLKPDLIKD